MLSTSLTRLRPCEIAACCSNIQCCGVDVGGQLCCWSRDASCALVSRDPQSCGESTTTTLALTGSSAFGADKGADSCCRTQMAVYDIALTDWLLFSQGYSGGWLCDDCGRSCTDLGSDSSFATSRFFCASCKSDYCRDCGSKKAAEAAKSRNATERPVNHLPKVCPAGHKCAWFLCLYATPPCIPLAYYVLLHFSE